MLKKNKALKFTPGKGYNELVRSATADLAQLENLVRAQTVSVMWRLGKSTHEHLLKNKDKAGYGKAFFENFAKDIDRDVTGVQRSVRFYLTYPSIPATWQELSWSQYRQLITIKDPNQRKLLEEQFVKKGFDARKSQAFLNFKKAQLAVKEDPQKPITQLAFTRGKLFIYKVIEVVDAESQETTRRLDLGFKVGRPIKEDFNKDDFVGVESPNEECALAQANVLADEIFTYKARVLKVIDGDTITVDMDTGLNEFIGQKLRLRGIDCPEMNTEEGIRAKRFVESRLKDCLFIIVKTHKDRSDMWDRYLADVFYAKGQSDPEKVAAEGTYLNQELLDKGLARVFE